MAKKVGVPEAVETVMGASQSSYPMELIKTFRTGRPVIRAEATAKTVVMRSITISVLPMCVVIKTNTALWKMARHQLNRRATRISTSAFTIRITIRAVS